MKIILFLIILLAAIWFGAFLGHCADRHLKPVTPNVPGLSTDP